MTKILITYLDRETQRRQALAKVYALLIRLAEETEAKSSSQEVAEAVEDSEPAAPSSAEAASADEAAGEPNPEISSID